MLQCESLVVARGSVKSMFKKKLIILAESLASSHCKSYVVQEKQ